MGRRMRRRGWVSVKSSRRRRGQPPPHPHLGFRQGEHEVPSGRWRARGFVEASMDDGGEGGGYREPQHSPQERRRLARAAALRPWQPRERGGEREREGREKWSWRAVRDDIGGGRGGRPQPACLGVAVQFAVLRGREKDRWETGWGRQKKNLEVEAGATVYIWFFGFRYEASEAREMHEKPKMRLQAEPIWAIFGRDQTAVTIRSDVDTTSVQEAITVCIEEFVLGVHFSNIFIKSSP